MAKIRFRDIEFKDDTIAIIAKMNKILTEYSGRVSVRQLYYRFVAADLIPNTQQSYNRIQNIITNARYAGMIDWDAIEDRNREAQRPAEFESGASALEQLHNNFRLNRWEGQPFYVEIWVEKAALAGILATISDVFHVTMMVNRGYCVDPNVLVLTADLRWVSASKVCAGDELVGVDEQPPGPKKHRRMRLAKVLGTQQFRSPRVLVSTNHGDIIVSNNHPFLTAHSRFNGYFWREAAKLLPGQRIARLCKPWSVDESRDGGWLAGMYDGEGWMMSADNEKRNAIEIAVCQKEGNVQRELRARLEARGWNTWENCDRESKVWSMHTGGIDRVLELVGSLRPTRMLAAAKRNIASGGWPSKCKEPAIVRSVTMLAPGRVIGIETDTATLITDGFVSHNSSASAMKESADRIRYRSGSTARPVVIYLGDHDPSGEDMVRDIRERLIEFGCPQWLNVRKLALTMEQIEQYNCPPNPAKVTDSRAAAYIEKFGDASWELDALPPDALEDMLADAVKSYIDKGKMDAVITRENKIKVALKKTAGTLTE